MKSKKILIPLIVLLSAGNVYANRDRGSWKKTLHDKAVFFTQHTAERHNIAGSYPSSIRLLPPKHYAGSQQGAWKQIVETGQLPAGWTVDHGATGLSNIAHTSSWTGCLLTAQAFHVAFLRDSLGTAHPEYQAAYHRADEIIHSLRILTLVTGQPGYLARGVAYGHGVGYEERAGSETRDLWGQGVGEFKHFRYRGGPSHHNYDQVFRGLGMYYFLAADDRQKKAVRDIVSDMSDWAHIQGDMVVRHVDGQRESTVLIGGWRGMGGNDRPSGGSLMAMTGLKLAHEIVAHPKTKTLYEKWVDRLGFRDPEKTKKSIMGEARTNYDDTDHLLPDLYLLNMLEKDPKLLAFYRQCVKDSWEVHKADKASLFNFYYQAVLGDEYGDPEGSIWHLQTFPTCRIFQPQMNSIRTDLEFHNGPRGKEAMHPLPVYARASDNEYHWKGSPFQLDGWISRIASVLELSPHDPYVQFAADTGGSAYGSNTNGEIWHAIDGLGGVRDFAFSPAYPWIVFAATTGGVSRSMDGGKSWSPTFSQPVQKITFDPENPNVLYATGPTGVHKSANLGERDMGTQWRTVTGTHPGGDVAYAVDPRGDAPKLYRLTRHNFEVKAESDLDWTAFEQPGRVRGFSGVDPIGGKPLWLRADAHLPNRLFRCVEARQRDGTGPNITVSDDGGKTWLPIVRELTPLFEWAQGTGKTNTMAREELLRLFEKSRELRITDLRVDRDDANTWYGLVETGVAVTHDAGQTWTVGHDGLDIPRPGALWTPRHAKTVMVGTPAGMYVSHDRAKTWQDTSLILQGEGAIRSEIGGIGYLAAYWMGRYHGFVTEQQANEKWWTVD
jgi:hypothetical protein